VHQHQHQHAHKGKGKGKGKLSSPGLLKQQLQFNSTQPHPFLPMRFNRKGEGPPRGPLQFEHFPQYNRPFKEDAKAPEPRDRERSTSQGRRAGTPHRMQLKSLYGQ
jgi:hypothetical protein